MAIGDYDDVLVRASRALRAVPEPGWAAIEERVIEAVRATPRGGWPMAVVDPEPDAAGQILVSDLVLRSLIARRVTEDPDVMLVDVTVTLDDEIAREVSIDISGRFGTELPRTAARIREHAREVVAEVIGRDDVAISVNVTDVHR